MSSKGLAPRVKALLLPSSVCIMQWWSCLLWVSFLPFKIGYILCNRQKQIQFSFRCKESCIACWLSLRDHGADGFFPAMCLKTWYHNCWVVILHSRFSGVLHTYYSYSFSPAWKLISLIPSPIHAYDRMHPAPSSPTYTCDLNVTDCDGALV